MLPGCRSLLCERELRALAFFTVTASLALSLHYFARSVLQSYPADGKDTLAHTVVHAVVVPAAVSLVIYLSGGFEEPFFGL